MRGEQLVLPDPEQEAVRLFRADLRVADRRVLPLLRAADVVQQAGRDHHVEVRRRLRLRNVQRRIQHAVHVLRIVRAALHRVQHTVFHLFVQCSFHFASSPHKI